MIYNNIYNIKKYLEMIFLYILRISRKSEIEDIYMIP